MNPPLLSSRQPHRPAFTIVELLVVVAILIILAALIFVGMAGAQRAAHKATCANNMRQIGVGLAGFVAEHGRYISDNRGADGDLIFDREILLQLDAPHSDKIAENKGLNVRTSAGLKTGVGELFICPADRLERNKINFKRSYAYVPWACNLSQFAEDIPRGFAHLQPNIGVPTSAVSSPSTSAIIVEWHAGKDTIENVLGKGSHQYHDRGGDVSGRDLREQCHAGSQNILFCDGHVESVPVMDSATFTKKYWPKDTRFNPSN